MPPSRSSSPAGHRSLTARIVAVGCLALTTAAIATPGKFLLSSEGSGRATAYIESPKIISFQGKTHVGWLDTPAEGFRIRVRTLDHATGEWTPAITIGEAPDNHGGPALTIDAAGYLHIVYYSHHHPFRYSRSVRPNDASEWTPFEEFGVDLTYPALVCAKDGTLVLLARRSFEHRPWDVEMWRKPPGQPWTRSGAILHARHGIYSQFAASLAWSPDHEILHLATRIYELPDYESTVPVTTVGYLSSPDQGVTWQRLDGTAVVLPATADTIDSLASARGGEGRILSAGSMGVGPDGKPWLAYSARLQDNSHAYLATPDANGRWQHLLLNQFLPPAYREWDLYMHGGISFGSSGQPTVLATVMQVPPGKHEWGEVSTEIVRFRSVDGGRTFVADILDDPDPTAPRWMPNLERATGFNEMPEHPGFLYTDGVKGEALGDQLSNKVYYVPANPLP